MCHGSGSLRKGFPRRQEKSSEEELCSLLRSGWLVVEVLRLGRVKIDWVGVRASDGLAKVGPGQLGLG